MDYIYKEDLIFDGLPEEEKEELCKEALQELIRVNPAAGRISVTFARDFLVKMELRKIINERYMKGGNRNDGGGKGRFTYGEQLAPGGDPGFVIENQSS